ncbi:MAG: hypothetical protein QXP36_13085 [Conexivisphaerales archaeon]
MFNRRIKINDILSNIDGKDYTFICGGEEFVQKYFAGLKFEGFNKIKIENWNRK